MHGLEIEFKYDVTGINESFFIQYLKKQKPDNWFRTFGDDHFFTHKKDKNSFIRFRSGNGFKELTFKRKLNKKNNYIRIENNLKLDVDANLDLVQPVIEAVSYKLDFSLTKWCTIFVFKDHIVVLYSILPKDKGSLWDIRSFIEIELAEDQYGSNKKVAMKRLIQLEKKYKYLGLSVKGRIKESIYEMYR